MTECTSIFREPHLTSGCGTVPHNHQRCTNGCGLARETFHNLLIQARVCYRRTVSCWSCGALYLYASLISVWLIRSGWGGWAFPFMSYGQRWRDGRRALWEHFSPAAVRQYDARLENSARRLLGALLDSSNKLDDAIR